MDSAQVVLWTVFATGIAVGYTAVSIVAWLEIRRMDMEFKAWRSQQGR